jgi:membrane-associated phospholipid phosphatase
LSLRQVIKLTLYATLACMALFALWPSLDLKIAGDFFEAGRFVGRNPAGVGLRTLFYYAPYVLLAGYLLAFAARFFQAASSGPDGRAMIFLLASLALGPGLLVNGVLKEHSHRPRPEQTIEFGGPWPFRPYETFDGACKSNCSFVSGEVATAAWTLAPALLTPPMLRPWAILAALLFTAVEARLRMAFGGHYFSDVTLAALFTFLIVLGLYRWYLRRPKP